ncbi:HAD family hydrolase [Dactylosporangium fulvum]|uniref:HAD-IA family hydrolase n=1 Tax=Dactylosporangium fulvum TaxID=53359 RepID=A0ABY5W4W9_9ACTN|nr:HAD-IA family hydrolase [Dactylosporangium fulvum]UWP85102.1 HAD-IA family hydrolase [Dactylosporangium fulvum]
MVISVLIFDFDGLLMDTETTLFECWRYEWRQHGLELDPARFFADHGGDVTEQRYAELARAVGPGYDRAASHARRIAYREELHATLGPAPGISEWFAEAAGLGLRLAVASSSPTHWVHGHLTRAGLLSRFEVVACGDEVTGHKPDPAVYLLALRRLGIAPEAAVAFEDTPHGVAAARAAGLRCVAVPNPYAARDRFGAADMVLRSAATTTLTRLLGELAAPSPAAGRR